MQRAAGTSSAGPPWHLLLGSTHAQVHQGLENGQHTLLRLTLDLYENTTASRIASLRVQSAQLMLLSTTRSSSASWRSPAAQENKAPQLLSGLRALLFRAEPRAYWRSGCKLRLRDLFCLGRRAPTCVLGCHGGRARASDCKATDTPARLEGGRYFGYQSPRGAALCQPTRAPADGRPRVGGAPHRVRQPLAQSCTGGASAGVHGLGAQARSRRVGGRRHTLRAEEASEEAERPEDKILGQSSER